MPKRVGVLMIVLIAGLRSSTWMHAQDEARQPGAVYDFDKKGEKPPVWLYGGSHAPPALILLAAVVIWTRHTSAPRPAQEPATRTRLRLKPSSSARVAGQRGHQCW